MWENLNMRWEPPKRSATPHQNGMSNFTKTESSKRSHQNGAKRNYQNGAPSHTETKCQISSKRSLQVIMLHKGQSVNSRRVTSRSVFRKDDSRHETRRGTIPTRDEKRPTKSSRSRYLLNFEPNATLPLPGINHVEDTNS